MEQSLDIWKRVGGIIDLITQSPRLAIYISSFFIVIGALLYKLVSKFQNHEPRRPGTPELEKSTKINNGIGKVSARIPGGMYAFKKEEKISN